MKDIFDHIDMLEKGGDVFDLIDVTAPAEQSPAERLRKMRNQYDEAMEQAREKVESGQVPDVQFLRKPTLWQRLPGGVPSQTARTIREPLVTLGDRLIQAYQMPGTQEVKEQTARDIIRQQIQQDVDSIHSTIQNDSDRRRWFEEAEALRGKFLAKTYRRWERGSAMVVGGGLHAMEELTRLVTIGRKGETLGEWAEIYHDVLEMPEMQPVIEHAMDKYLGGGVEMAPFLVATMLPGLGTKAAATIPTSIGPMLVSGMKAISPAATFLTTYGIEGNSVYQGLKNKGYTEADARTRGLVAGLINAGIELSGGSGDKYFRQNAIDAATKKLGRFRYFSRKALRTALAEGLAEEVPQEAVSMILGREVPRREDGGIDWAKAADQMLDVAVMGTIVGGLVATPIVATEAMSLPSFTEGEVVSVSRDAAAIPGRTYEEAKTRTASEISGQNPWIKQEQTRTNKDRVLLVQFSSDLLTEGKEDPAARAYYDKLYAKRPGYARLGDTWEIPKWITEAANFVPGADVYFVRDMAEARQFLKSSGYGKVMFSALDVNTQHIQDLAKGYAGKVVVGGYVGEKAPFAKIKNVTWYDSMPDMAKGEGYEYKAGVNLSHFEGSRTVPRLCMSEGCKHKCAFCVVPKTLKETPQELVESQIDAMKDLDVRLIYLDDKTFGQAKNHAMLPDLYWRMKKQNPEFDGFVIQTTASQFARFSDDFVTNAHIRYVEFGVESYNDVILKELHKPHNEARIDEAMAKARRLKVNVIPNIIIGFPQETADTYARTLAYLEANTDVISHVNAYNLALYEGTEITGKTIGEGKPIEDIDVNENAVAKSFHKDPQLHMDFAQRVYDFGSRMLDHDPVGRVGLTPDQAIAQQYGVEPGRVDILFREAEDRYRELKAKPVEKRKGRRAGTRTVRKDVEPEPVARDPRLYAILPGLKRRIVDLSTGELERRVVKASPHYKLYAEELAARRKEREQRPVKIRERVEIPATGEHAELAFLSRYRNDIEAILKDLTSDDPVLTLELRPKQVPTTRTERELLERGHGIAQQLGMTEEERRVLMVELTGKKSMTEMDSGQQEQFVQYLELALEERGETYEPKPSSYYEMLDLLQNRERPSRIEKPRSVRDTLANMRDGLQQANWEFTRLDRFFEWLDGADAEGNGWFKRTFYRPVVQANARRNLDIDADIYALDDLMTSLGVNPGTMLSKSDRINDHLEMTAFDRIGVFMLWMNEKGKSWLEQMGYTEDDVADVYAFMGGDGSPEVQIAEYMFNYYESFWPIIQRVAISVGVDEKSLQQEFLYSPIMLKDRMPDEQTSLADYFEDTVFDRPGVKPEQRFLEKRVGPRKGAKIETNAMVLFVTMANRLNTFKEMAPIAYTLSRMLNDRQFSKALNQATNGMGTDLVNTWLKHAVRGHGDRSNNVLIRGLTALRNSGVFYSIGFNVPSVMRQAVGTLNTLSHNPGLIPHFIRTSVQSLTGGFMDLHKKVSDRSDFVKHRSLEEILRKKWTKDELIRRYGRRASISTLSMKFLHDMDMRSVTLSWWSLYQMKLKQGASEQEAITFAEEWLAKTQEVSDAVYLPDVMRNGVMATMYRLMFPFTNQINNQLNQYMYDNWAPIRQKGWRSGGPLTAYRFLLSWVIPALVFGLIKRGRLQKEPEEVGIDLIEYPLAPLLMLGDFVMYAVTGESKRGELYEMGFQSAADTVRSVLRGDVRGAMKNAARSVGIIGGAISPRLRGAVTAQTVRSIEAAYDLVFSEKKPPAYSLVVGERQARMSQKKKAEKPGRIKR